MLSNSKVGDNLYLSNLFPQEISLKKQIEAHDRLISQIRSELSEDDPGQLVQPQIKTPRAEAVHSRDPAIEAVKRDLDFGGKDEAISTCLSCAGLQLPRELIEVLTGSIPRSILINFLFCSSHPRYIEGQFGHS